jgi:ABC-type multidrug transport system ATPase subunit
MIVLTGIVKSYAGRRVLDIPSFRFQEGKKYALLGPNGSGKSTLIKILTGILKQDEGTVSCAVPPEKIAYLPQSPYAFDLSVFQNVLLCAAGPDRKARARAAVDAVGLEAFLHARGSRLSGGETQRMALARLLAGDYRLLLLDEPTSAADLSAGDRMEAALMKYAAHTGCTILFSTHAPSLALRLADEGVMLDGGRIVEAGDIHALLSHPREAATQRFLQHWRI